MAQIKLTSVIQEHMNNPHLGFRLLVSILSLAFVFGSLFVYKNTYLYEPVEIPKDTTMTDYVALINTQVGSESPPKLNEMKSTATYLNKKKSNTKPTPTPNYADYQKIANSINNK